MNIEPRTLKLTEIDGTHYVKLCDVERLLHDLRRDVYDNAPVDGVTEDGLKKYNLTETDREVLNYLYFVSSCIRRQLVNTCESPDEIKALHERIRKAYYADKYYLSETTQEDDGGFEVLYFRKYCPGVMAARLKEEGKTEEEIEQAIQEEDGDPVFTDNPKYAQLFEGMEEADANMKFLNNHMGMDLEVFPAFLLDTKGCKELLDKLLKEDDEEQKEGGEDDPD